MPFTTSYLADIDAVLTVYAGVITPAELHQAAAVTLSAAKDHRTRRLLGDCRALEGGHTIVDLYGLGELLATMPSAVGIREALVMPQLSAAARDVQFWETTCRNRGIDVRVFKSMTEAREWLNQRAAPAKS